MSRQPYLKCLFVPLMVAVAAAFAAPVTATELPDSPDGTVRVVMEQLVDRKPEIIWQALPPSYQQDITELTHLFASKMDPEVWDATFALGNRTTALLRDKKEIMLQSSYADMAGEERKSVENSWDTVISLLGAFFSSDISSLDKLQTMDWESYFTTTGRDLMKMAAERSKASGDDTFDEEFTKKLQNTEVEVISRDGDRATVKVTAPDDDPEEMELVRVESRWVPAEMADGWDDKVAEARSKLNVLTDDEIEQGSMQAMMFIGMMQGVVMQLEAVETSEEFEQSIQGLLGPFLEGMMGGMEEGFEDAGGAESEASGG